jgi:hypothetical protein
MARSIFLVTIAGLAFFAAPASAEGPRAEGTITLSRVPMGLHALDAPDYDVALSLDGHVVVHRRSYMNSNTKLERSEQVEAYRVSPAEAARFRAALMPHKPLGLSPTIICGGHVYSRDNSPLIRVPLFEIDWKDKESSSVLAVCITPQERPIVDDIRQGLEALHLLVDGSRMKPPG